jgi:TPR repeat protein
VKGEADRLVTTARDYMLHGGSKEVAERWFRQVAGLGHVGAMTNLASLLEDRGEPEEALEWHRKGARAGWRTADHPDYRWPGEGADGGIADAMLKCGVALDQHGCVFEAREWLSRGVEVGDPRAADALAQLAAAFRRPLTAMRWWDAAGELAVEHLESHWGSLRRSYGDAGIRRYVDLLRRAARYLDTHDDPLSALRWNQTADKYEGKLKIRVPR